MQEEYEYENPCQEFRPTLAELNDWKGSLELMKEKYGLAEIGMVAMIPPPEWDHSHQFQDT